MARKFDADLPPDYDLLSSWVVRLTALDASTGSLVTGVNVSNVAIMAAPVVPATQEPGEPLLVPTPPEWLNLPISGS